MLIWREQTVPVEHNANYTLILAKRKVVSTYVKEIILKIDTAHIESFESSGDELWFKTEKNYRKQLWIISLPALKFSLGNTFLTLAM